MIGCTPDGTSPSLRDARQPVAFFANGLGDTILTLPALRAIAEMYRNQVTLICDLDIPQIFFREFAIAKIIETKMVRNVPDWTREFSAADVARQCGAADAFISLVPWHSRSLRELLGLLHPKCSVGFFDDFDLALDLDFGKHAADLAFDVPLSIDNTLSFLNFAAPPTFAPADIERATDIVSLICPSYRILTVHADTGAEKMWPTDRFIDVLDQFLARHPDYFVLLVGGDIQPLDGGRFGDRVAPCYGLPVGAAFKLVCQSDLFLGVDSCMLHAADFCRVPSVGLFGCSDPVQFGFRLTPHGAICQADTMLGISVGDVLNALEDVEGAVRGRELDEQPPVQERTQCGTFLG